MSKLLCTLVTLASTSMASVALARAPQSMPAPLPRAAQSMRSPVLYDAKPFRQVTATGTTKPSGIALDRRLGTTPLLDAAGARLGMRIRTTICTGC